MIAKKSNVKIAINYNQVPIYTMAIDFVKKKVYPKGAVDNYNFVKDSISSESNSLDWWKLLILADPVTSGGLLMSIPREKSKDFEEKAESENLNFWRIGEVLEGEGLLIYE